MKLHADPTSGSAGEQKQQSRATGEPPGTRESPAILQQRLDAAEARIRVLLDTSADAILWVNERCRIASVNRATEELFGYSPAAAVGRELSALLPNLDGAFLLQQVSHQHCDAVGETTAIHQDGSSFPVEVSVGAVAGPGPERYTLRVHDLTEQKILQEQIFNAQRMVAVGSLAGGIAHDFNNFLTVFSCNIELMIDALRRQQTPDPVLLAAIDQIQQAWRGASGLTKQLLAFSRRQAVQPKVLDANQVIGDMERMLRPLLGEHIHFEIIRRPGVGSVEMDLGYFEQVLMNLAINARDAMPEGGTLRIQTSCEPWPAECAGDGNEVSQPYLCIAVSDTGTGMEPEVADHVFEPFFTTKPVGKGTGLGLSTVDGIVRLSNGFIKVETTRGQGTTFKVYLPMVDAAPTTEAPAIPVVSSLRGHETVLLCEDEITVLRLAERILLDNGYTVLATNNPHQALELAAASDVPIHLLITDAIMPEMTGPRLAEILSSEHPEMQVLFVSGYTADILYDFGLATEAIELLEKPFTPAGLLQRVRQLFDQLVRAASPPRPAHPVRVPPARQPLCATR